jgi:opacity protein-like surface antigen
MQFNKLVAVIAILGLSLQANAYSDGTLRRSVQVAQNDTTVVTESEPAQGVVIMNSNTSTNTTPSSASSAAVSQPTTVVEAAPVTESKAELMRKARQGEEVKTEQKIVEKLEESRLREEQQRAERLFGNKLDAPPAAAAATATAVATPDAAAATATAVVVPEPKQEEVKPTQVTIEKVEIVQPKDEISEKPEAVSSMKVEEPAKDDEKSDKFFVGGILAAPNYDTSNVKSNFGLGVSLGVNLETNWVIEGSFLYSNHNVDTYWQFPLYRELDQYDFTAAAKYYILSGKLKPYVGASISYIYRKYTSRSQYGNNPYGYGYPYDTTSTDEDSNSVNGGLTAGVDFAISKNILLGGGLDYSFNLMNRQDFQSQYGLPGGIKPLEEIDYTLIKVNAKMTF